MQERDKTDGWQAGCSALSWHAADGSHYWGRNFDYNRIAPGSGVIGVPSGEVYQMCVGAIESGRTAAYACVGTGLLLPHTTPLVYEGINEKGLMGGQLYYRQFAHYAQLCRPGTLPLQPPILVYHLLAQCESVEQVVWQVQHTVTLVDTPLLGTTPPLHWCFSDRTGEMVVIEPNADGVRIYRNTLGIMTNSPDYSWHRNNLLNYAGLRAQDYAVIPVGAEQVAPCFSGTGAQGLPGDWSSPSRFVRLAFLRRYAVPGENEQQAVPRMFRLLQSAAFPLGAVQVQETQPESTLDQTILPYDYTVYTSVMCAESLRYYWTTYENPSIRSVSLQQFVSAEHPVRMDHAYQEATKDAILE